MLSLACYKELSNQTSRILSNRSPVDHPKFRSWFEKDNKDYTIKASNKVPVLKKTNQTVVKHDNDGIIVELVTIEAKNKLITTTMIPVRLLKYQEPQNGVPTKTNLYIPKVYKVHKSPNNISQIHDCSTHVNAD